MRDERGYYMRTISGQKIYILDPRPEDFKIEDIAHHLALTNRFNGGTIFPFSVARHSIIISQNLPKHLQLEGLLHDAHEMSVGDDVTPKKKAIVELKMLDNLHDHAMRVRFDLPDVITPEVKFADLRMYVTEVLQLRPFSSNDFPELEPFNVTLKETNWMDDREEFLDRYRELTASKQRHQSQQT